jgi:anthranilate synthase
MFASTDYVTRRGIRVSRVATELDYPVSLAEIAATLDRRRGVLLSSSYEMPGRYTRWSMTLVNPPIEIVTRGPNFTITALNDRGEVLLPALSAAIAAIPQILEFSAEGRMISGLVPAPTGQFDEGERGRQASVFTVLRAILDLFHSDEDSHLGLYGAFGYDLVFQFDPMTLAKSRPDDQRDLVLYLPDELTLVDNRWERGAKMSYEFEIEGRSTAGLPRDGADIDYRGKALQPFVPRELPEGGYAAIVRRAQQKFRAGDLFEVVPSQCFFEATEARPSELFAILSEINPSPYGFLMNLGQEYLVGASPEMFVRVAGTRVETCPISGTIRRGRDALEDAEQIRTLLNSAKDEAELTMCTDVDRNDKSRVCVPDTVKVIGRRQIELYSHVIHTVDHVEGQLAAGFDALDAFLTHMWAVTVTGAPKRAAIGFVEAAEIGVRRWYGGAVGRLGFNGNLETGLTLRTLRVADGIAEIRVGATLLQDSNPDEEEAETVLKAAAARQTLLRAKAETTKPPVVETVRPSSRPTPHILMIDCEDSFVHTLASYLRADGAEVRVLRHGFAEAALASRDWDLVVLSPGPGRPADFGVPRLIVQASERGLPVFGVCLGMQGIVEAFGGELATLEVPQHGRSATITPLAGSRLFDGLPERFMVGRYHSIHAPAATLPACLTATAHTADGIVMAVEHVSLPVAGVQFHPESIMTGADRVGHRIIANVLSKLVKQPG